MLGFISRFKVLWNKSNEEKSVRKRGDKYLMNIYYLGHNIHSITKMYNLCYFS